jgi:hypothetical protein
MFARSPQAPNSASRLKHAAWKSEFRQRHDEWHGRIEATAGTLERTHVIFGRADGSI